MRRPCAPNCAKKGKTYSAAALTAFGETLAEAGNPAPGTKHSAPSTFFTGKPQVDGLGRVFLFRNYRTSLAKWQTADPLGYPDGWNQLAYCGNGVLESVDLFGTVIFGIYDYNRRGRRISSVGEVPIVRTSRNDGEGGCCVLEERVVYIEATKTLDLRFYMKIEIALACIASDDAEVGAIVSYGEHQGLGAAYLSDTPLIYEGVLAHERGHADYDINTRSVQLQTQLSTVEGLWQNGILSLSEVQQQVNL